MKSFELFFFCGKMPVEKRRKYDKFKGFTSMKQKAEKNPILISCFTWFIDIFLFRLGETPVPIYYDIQIKIYRFSAD